MISTTLKENLQSFFETKVNPSTFFYSNKYIYYSFNIIQHF